MNGDNYQAVYDAVRSRLGNCNVGDVVRDVAYQCFDIGHAKALLQEQIAAVGNEMLRPSTLYRPELVQDGNAFLAMYGDLPTGCVGTGSSPAAAMADFDAAWHRAAIANADNGGRDDAGETTGAQNV